MKKYLLTTLLVTTLLLSCTTTKYVTMPEVHYRDSLVVRYQHDSIFTRDSVFVNQWTKGDTVFRDRVRVQYLYKYLTRQDTVSVERRDSVPYVVEKVTTVNKYLTHWYDQICRRFTLAVLIAAAAIIVAWLVKKRK